ncbi:hypothetical protein GCM10017044_06230 [Kordiimonas sediminis]|uniref:Sulfur reduction protein DsrE n=1 Tax=Kordiimonas sediminis TaxID=1735581 RepID=A0A919E372_9PROT|nr:DsrE family protein [Kordiimonas sediminis]GHF14866.1 hypothetical protein GCM10017044_06230 [Kordiimonas sediminis]
MLRAILIFLTGVSCLISASVSADEPAFKKGPVFPDYGKIAVVNNEYPLPDDFKLKVAFDIIPAAKPGEVNRALDKAARFINMHVDAGVPLENITVALVLHGNATLDAANAATYREKTGQENGNIDLIKALNANGVHLYLCGQSAASRGITTDNKLPEIKMALSAMTAHAQLQQDGYTLNPF